MIKKLINTIFTRENCKDCNKGIWKKIDCEELIKHNSEFLNEEHEVYLCSAKCDVPGYKTEIYKL